jgi:hypothetical protein
MTLEIYFVKIPNALQNKSATFWIQRFAIKRNFQCSFGDNLNITKNANAQKTETRPTSNQNSVKKLNCKTCLV